MVTATGTTIFETISAMVRKDDLHMCREGLCGIPLIGLGNRASHNKRRQLPDLLPDTLRCLSISRACRKCRVSRSRVTGCQYVLCWASPAFLQHGLPNGVVILRLSTPPSTTIFDDESEANHLMRPRPHILTRRQQISWTVTARMRSVQPTIGASQTILTMSCAAAAGF